MANEPSPAPSKPPAQPAAASTAPAAPVSEPFDEARYLARRRRRVPVGLGLSLLGFLIFLLGLKPALFGLDRSPVIGFVQIATFLVGLAIICLGGYTCLIVLWKTRPISIAADIGVRLVATGYVVCVFAGMADIFGIGGNPAPSVPYFGELQARGVEVGLLVILIGFLLIIPYHQYRKR
ncbi:MAG TPA: hypothetical protein PKW33_06390 [Anaerolineaceae bacterium]|nr:hypothetical protein [Anaerolineaceae bacterium]HPN51196.1 hypothetical protein [Anaerolineaceae bacterium]